MLLRVNDLKEYLYDITSNYFTDTTVVWANSYTAKPPLPFVLIRVDQLSTNTFPIEDGLISSYLSKVNFQIDLYVAGHANTEEEKILSATADTSLEEMQSFLNYIRSPGILEIANRIDINIEIMNTIANIPELLNDIRYQGRSVAMFTVDFMQNITGEYGSIDIDNRIPLPNVTIDNNVHYFSSVEIKEE